MTAQFVVKTQNGQLSIAKRDVVLTSGTSSREYNGEPLTNGEVTVSGDGFVGEEGAAYDVTGSQTLVGSSENFFTYELQANTKAENYNITTQNGTLTVTNRPEDAKYEITVVAKSGGDKYDGSEQSVSGFEATTFEVDGNTYTVEGLAAEAKATDAGTYPVNVTGTAVVRDADNNDVTAQFVVKTQNGQLVIGQREVVVAAKDSSKTFGASDPAFTATVTGEVEGEEGIIEYTVSRPGAGVDEAVDTYVDAIVVAGDADQGNYTVSYEPADFTITQQSITPGPDPDNPDPSYQGIKVSQPADQVYNGNYQQPEIVVTDSEGNTLDASIDGGATGDYVITYGNNVNATSEGNLATAIVKGINNYSGEVVQTFQIAPAKATVLVNDSAKVYGEDDPVGYNGYSVVLEGTDQPLYTNMETKVQDTLGDITVVRPGMGTDENAVVYEDALDVSVANQNANYTYTVDKGNFTISAAGGNVVTLASQAEGNTKIYDGQSISIDASASKPGSTLWYSTDGENWTETKPSLTNVGTLTIYVKATNPNYKDSAVVSATVQVAPRPVTITTDSAAKIFDGVTLTAEGYEITSGSFVEGETYGVDFGDSGQTAAGQSDNDATVVFAGEGNEYTAQSDNYNVTVVPGKLTVYPQSIDPNDPDPDNPDPEDPDPTDPDPENPDQPFYNGVKVTAPEDVYYNGLSQEQAPVVTDRDGNPIDLSYYDVTYSADTVNVGTVTITVTGKNGYTGSTQVTYNILKVALAIATPSAGKVYDGTPLQNQIVTAEGWQDNDGSQVTLTATGSITNVGSAYNTYTVSDPDGVLNNYNVIDNLGVLTVWPQSINPTDPGDDPDPEDPAAPDPSDPDPDFPDYDPTDPDPEGPDPDQPFYTGATVDDPESVPYDGNEHQWTPTVTDNEGNTLTPGEDYTVSYSTDDFTNVGTITVTITGTGNYGGSVEKTYQITPAQITVNIANQTKVQGSADPTFTFNYSGVVEGETMAWTGEFVREVGEAVGDYAVMQGGFVLADNPEGNFDASNYTLVVNPGTLTVTAATTPVVPDTPDTPTPTPDTPDTPTPLPTPGTPTPVPTPAPGDDGATPTDGLTATTGDDAEEAIDDEATPLTAPEPIDDDGTPLASGAHRDCWVHWLMLLGILVTVVYYGGVGVRRVRFSSSLQSFEDDVLGNDETNR